MKKPTWNELSLFVRGYLTAAYWTTDEDAGSGEYCMERERYAQTTKASVQKAIADCETFERENETLLASYYETREPRGDYSAAECAGHDFWLSRNGHGAGYFDRFEVPEETRDALQRAARGSGESYCSFYRGRVYIE